MIASTDTHAHEVTEDRQITSDPIERPLRIFAWFNGGFNPLVMDVLHTRDLAHVRNGIGAASWFPVRDTILRIVVEVSADHTLSPAA